MKLTITNKTNNNLVIAGKIIPAKVGSTEKSVTIPMAELEMFNENSRFEYDRIVDPFTHFDNLTYVQLIEKMELDNIISTTPVTSTLES